MDNNKKHTGSYYTPKIIADFLVDYLSKKLIDKSNISILEPSVGDGIFIHSIFNHNQLFPKIEKIIAIEQDEQELNKIPYTQPIFHGVHSDFLEYQKNDNAKFNLVIGNPPYIKKNLLKEYQLDLCKEIHSNAALSDTQPKNIWTAFLVRCIRYLDDSGILALVLPSELLQVKFAAELRAFILKEFERVEIFTFNELLFKDCKGQDTLLLIGEKKSNHKGVYYCNIDKIDELKNAKFNLESNISIRESKWTHHHITADESELLAKLKGSLFTIDHYCNSKAGIVTAANNYFIVDRETVKQYSLQKHVRPIIQKGLFVNGSVVLSDEEFQTIIDDSKPSFLMALDKHSKFKNNKRILEYLKIGEEKEIHKRYKTSIRQNWYEVPNVGVPPEAFFFKRCHDYPKLIKNNANVLSTDSAYIISMKETYKIERLIFSFYNSLTLSFAELYGRYYGGGVLELTPNEFKILPVPYLNISESKFDRFNKEFKNKSSIKDICIKNDTIILKSIDKNIDSDTIEKIFKIREKLFQRRIKTN